ncbi:uncharacterized protein N7459_002641 [Penicillium hispanicum]|uniref:uncharacterized protein n=1 Tax=Penicillium hispanicum TaxID=1080232 RepID=UPI002541D2A2|nr:uncharacterized protein N7459_002641 [Penicillium hispanicum]KAJ5586876.1 hypothetical protein N7459_002641 [Penicillium hispanicum]
MSVNWKATALLTCLAAAETVHGLPKPPGTVAEEILQKTATAPAAAFKTQYPPADAEERLLIPESHPVYRVALENEGRPSQLPFPTFNLDGILDGVSGFLSPPNPTSAPVSAPASLQQPKPSVSSIVESVSESLVAEPTPTSIGDRAHTTQSGHPNKPSTMKGQDIFQPVATSAPPANVKARHDHPVANKHANTTDPIETNKFYAGLFLGSQTNASFTQPYSLAWSKGSGTLKSWGMGVSHVEPDMLAFGPKNNKLPGQPVEYYINPVGLQHIILSASELDESTVLNVEEPKGFSAQAVLKRSGGSAQTITYPVVQGMGYVTGVYNGLQPLIESGVFFRKVVSAVSPKSGIFKYQVTLEDNTDWVLYATPTDGKDPDLKLVSKSSLQGPHGFSGTIQVAKNPAGPSGEKFYDNSAGVYPVAGQVDGSVAGHDGTYSLSWTKAGKHAEGTPLIMFALPHHVQSFDRSTAGRATSIQLRTTTKGNATAVIGETWTMAEPELPVDMGFAPWSPTKGTVQKLSANAQQVIAKTAPTELKQDIDAQTDLNSMYYSGKALSKFATLVYTVSQLGNDAGAAKQALEQLKKSFARFVQNKQQFPLAYDSVWKGAVSTAGYGGDLNSDFGNTAYNDHHFHYGYFIQAAAIIGALDPSWLPENKDWVNMLVRDAGNSVENDPYFPFSRGFDWYSGHSWAKGLFESYDGKDEESTSEDTMFAYAVKMWGQTIGDASMEARGNMMLGIMRRSLDNYFLMRRNNTNQPENFIGNKVTGILFENKVDHTTYFGNNLEYIQGIHMLPLLPNSAYTRQREFVTEEWNAIFSANASTPASKVEGGWKGVLYANLALIDPQAAWDFFAADDFDYNLIDGGASRTWYLAYAAGLGGGH